MHLRLKNRVLVKAIFILLSLLYVNIAAFALHETDSHSSFYQSESINIKNVNGKFYAYIVLLFNENPHFVNLIQKGSIPLKMIGNEGFNVKAYKSYQKSIRIGSLKKSAETMLAVYLEPNRFSDAELYKIEEALTKYNIVLKFSREKHTGLKNLTLDYCIYGKKSEINVKHPLVNLKEKIYNIQPFIYYDEFSTSNSTFYYDMIYINSEEVLNDSMIARKIIRGGNVTSNFFVGSRVTDDIKYCLLKTFNKNSPVRDIIWEMFVVHELTHKIINNRYNYYDQVSGEELSLMSTIYHRPYLGLSVMYCYLNYNAINPHRIAAANFVRYVSEKTGKVEIIDKPELIKFMTHRELKNISKKYFFDIFGRLNR